MVHFGQQKTDLIFLALALGDVQAAAEDPEGPPARLILAKASTAHPGHPAHLAAGTHEAKVHFNLIGGCPACSRFVLLADPRHIVPVNA